MASNQANTVHTIGYNNVVVPHVCQISRSIIVHAHQCKNIAYCDIILCFSGPQTHYRLIFHIQFEFIYTLAHSSLISCDVFLDHYHWCISSLSYCTRRLLYPSPQHGHDSSVYSPFKDCHSFVAGLVLVAMTYPYLQSD